MPDGESLTEARKKRAKKNRLVAYENAGAKQLADQPGKMSKNPRPADPDWQYIRGALEARLNQMRSWRFSWMSHWTLLEAYILPRRGIFINQSMPTANTMIRGIAINENIIDPTGTYAMRRCAAGLMSGSMSPSRPWFKLKPALFGREAADTAAKIWFETVEDRMYQIMARSNYYDSCAQVFEDLVTFGSGPMIIYEDNDDIIRCYTPCPGEYFLSSSSSMRVESMYRQFVMTIAQIVEMFGLENCPREVQQMWQSKGGALEVERIVAHAIEPNFAIDVPGIDKEVGVVPGEFTWRECYWVWGASADYPLSVRGFRDQPHTVPRWATTSNDPYGRSVGMDVLPDIMQLQVETKRKAEAIEKQVRPPMLGSMELKNEPSSILPGHVTYVNQLGPDKGMRPMYTVTPEIREMMEDLAQIQQRIKEGFFNDIFAMLEQVKKDMTAYEVAQRNNERLQVLGPIIERLQNEKLGPDIKRIFKIMERKGMLPPLPPSLIGVPLGIEYVGMLALAQKASSTASLERFAATMGNMGAADPLVNDLWDRDIWTREYSDDLYLHKEIMRSPQAVAKIRAARAKAQQNAAQMQTAQTALQGAQTLSQLPVGGGQSALEAMLGRGGGGGGGETP